MLNGSGCKSQACSSWGRVWCGSYAFSSHLVNRKICVNNAKKQVLWNTLSMDLSVGRTRKRSDSAKICVKLGSSPICRLPSGEIARTDQKYKIFNWLTPASASSGPDFHWRHVDDIVIIILFFRVSFQPRARINFHPTLTAVSHFLPPPIYFSFQVPTCFNHYPPNIYFWFVRTGKVHFTAPMCSLCLKELGSEKKE